MDRLRRCFAGEQRHCPQGWIPFPETGCPVWMASVPFVVKINFFHIEWNWVGYLEEALREAASTSTTFQ